MILTLAAKELRSLFSSPLAWIVLALLQLILAWVFLMRLDSFLELQPRLAQLGALRQQRGWRGFRHAPQAQATTGSASCG